MRLSGRVALITGASRGIGRAIAQRFAEEGASVALHGRSEEALREAEAECRQANVDVCVLRGDLRAAETCEAIVDGTVARFGQVDIVVNNAAIVAEELLVLLDDERLESVVATNVLAVCRVTRAALKSMLRKRSGAIVNVSSVAASLPGRGNTVYAGTKGFVESFTRAVAAEVSRKGIRVNAIAPGVIETTMNEAFRQAAGEELRKRIAQRRFGSVADVASAAAWLASDEAAYVNGAVIAVDGGFGLGG